MQHKLSEMYPKRRAFITGAGSGLGEALALALASDGWTLGITDMNQSRLDAIASKIEGMGAKAFPFVFDVADKAAFGKAAKDFIHYVGIDVLINNAGVGDGGWFDEYSLEAWEWILGINQMGVIYGCHYFVPTLKAQQSGTIINIASAASFANLPKMSAYNVSKAAVRSLSDTLHAELKPSGIHVAVVMPTFFQTNIMEQAKGSEEAKAEAALMIKRSNLKPDAVAAIILSDAAKGKQYIHGTRQSKMVHWFSRMFPQLMSKLRVKMVQDPDAVKKYAR